MHELRASFMKKNSVYCQSMILLLSEKVCKRPWNFERVPNSIIQGHDRALIFTSTKEACLAACLNEVRIASKTIIIKPFTIFSIAQFHLPKCRVQLCHAPVPSLRLRQADGERGQLQQPRDSCRCPRRRLLREPLPHGRQLVRQDAILLVSKDRSTWPQSCRLRRDLLLRRQGADGK